MKTRRITATLPLVFTFLTVLIIGGLAPRTGHALEDYKKNYLKGIELADKGEYEEAVKSFELALEERSKEQKRIRYYGMRYGEYFPHREKGISLYKLKRYRNAIAELEFSLKKFPNEETKKYLALARMEQANLGDQDLFKVVETPKELKKIPKARAVNKYAVAVVIGNRDYEDRDIPPATYAIEDAKLFKDYLIKTFGVREGNIIFKTNATKGIFDNIFGTHETYKGQLYQYIKPGQSDIYVYYSGHGAPNIETKKGYIMPIDANPDSIAIGGYSLDLLYGNLAKMKGRRVTVITDACFSGSNILKKASPVGIIVKNPLAASRNTTLINSSAGTEISSWYPKKGHGMFTYWFLRGLTGEADLDHNKTVSASEMNDYLSDNIPYMVRKLYNGRKQTPSIKSVNMSQPLVSFR